MQKQQATAAAATPKKQDIDQLSINTIRTLAMDAVEAAKSGHPGTPMALAPVAYTLWNEVLRYDPADPTWPDRDRFVLSCGHASMLLYSTLHLAGVRQVEHGKVTDGLAVPLDDIRKFRQFGSRTPGHPENLDTSGVETTTGPLGQGIGNSVGMAIAQRWLAEHFNRPGSLLFDYNVYALCSDGDMMEGVGNEAASIAGHLRLSNLCWIYDDNHITIEGNTSLAYTDDAGRRFEGLGWHVIRVADANDLPALRTRVSGVSQDRRPADADHRAQPYRLRSAPQARHARGPRRTAGRGRNPRRQGLLRLAGGCQVPRARRSHGTLGGRHRRGVASCTPIGNTSSTSTPASIPSWLPSGGKWPARELPAGLGQGSAHFSRRRQGHGQPRFVGQGAQRRGQERALADRRLGRSGPLDPDRSDVRGGRRVRAGQLRRAAISISAFASMAWPRPSTAWP